MVSSHQAHLEPLRRMASHAVNRIVHAIASEVVEKLQGVKYEDSAELSLNENKTLWKDLPRGTKGYGIMFESVSTLGGVIPLFVAQEALRACSAPKFLAMLPNLNRSDLTTSSLAASSAFLACADMLSVLLSFIHHMDEKSRGPLSSLCVEFCISCLLSREASKLSQCPTLEEALLVQCGVIMTVICREYSAQTVQDMAVQALNTALADPNIDVGHFMGALSYVGYASPDGVFSEMELELRQKERSGSLSWCRGRSTCSSTANYIMSILAVVIKSDCPRVCGFGYICIENVLYSVHDGGVLPDGMKPPLQALERHFLKQVGRFTPAAMRLKYVVALLLRRNSDEVVKPSSLVYDKRYESCPGSLSVIMRRCGLIVPQENMHGLDPFEAGETHVSPPPLIIVDSSVVTVCGEVYGVCSLLLNGDYRFHTFLDDNIYLMGSCLAFVALFDLDSFSKLMDKVVDYLSSVSTNEAPSAYRCCMMRAVAACVKELCTFRYVEGGHNLWDVPFWISKSFPALQRAMRAVATVSVMMGKVADLTKYRVTRPGGGAGEPSCANLSQPLLSDESATELLSYRPAGYNSEIVGSRHSVWDNIQKDDIVKGKQKKRLNVFGRKNIAMVGVGRSSVHSSAATARTTDGYYERVLSECMTNFGIAAKRLFSMENAPDSAGRPAIVPSAVQWIDMFSRSLVYPCAGCGISSFHTLSDIVMHGPDHWETVLCGFADYLCVELLFSDNATLTLLRFLHILIERMCGAIAGEVELNGKAALDRVVSVAPTSLDRIESIVVVCVCSSNRQVRACALDVLSGLGRFRGHVLQGSASLYRKLSKAAIDQGFASEYLLLGLYCHEGVCPTDMYERDDEDICALENESLRCVLSAAMQDMTGLEPLQTQICECAFDIIAKSRAARGTSGFLNIEALFFSSLTYAFIKNEGESELFNYLLARWRDVVENEREAEAFALNLALANHSMIPKVYLAMFHMDLGGGKEVLPDREDEMVARFTWLTATMVTSPHWEKYFCGLSIQGSEVNEAVYLFKVIGSVLNKMGERLFDPEGQARSTILGYYEYILVLYRVGICLGKVPFHRKLLYSAFARGMRAEEDLDNRLSDRLLFIVGQAKDVNLKPLDEVAVALDGFKYDGRAVLAHVVSMSYTLLPVVFGSVTHKRTETFAAISAVAGPTGDPTVLFRMLMVDFASMFDHIYELTTTEGPSNMAIEAISQFLVVSENDRPVFGFENVDANRLEKIQAYLTPSTEPLGVLSLLSKDRPEDVCRCIRYRGPQLLVLGLVSLQSNIAKLRKAGLRIVASVVSEMKDPKTQTKGIASALRRCENAFDGGSVSAEEYSVLNLVEAVAIACHSHALAVSSELLKIQRGRQHGSLVTPWLEHIRLEALPETPSGTAVDSMLREAHLLDPLCHLLVELITESDGDLSLIWQKLALAVSPNEDIPHNLALLANLAFFKYADTEDSGANVWENLLLNLFRLRPREIVGALRQHIVPSHHAGSGVKPLQLPLSETEVHGNTARRASIGDFDLRSVGIQLFRRLTIRADFADASLRLLSILMCDPLPFQWDHIQDDIVMYCAMSVDSASEEKKRILWKILRTVVAVGAKGSPYLPEAPPKDNDLWRKSLLPLFSRSETALVALRWALVLEDDSLAAMTASFCIPGHLWSPNHTHLCMLRIADAVSHYSPQWLSSSPPPVKIVADKFCNILLAAGKKARESGRAPFEDGGAFGVLWLADSLFALPMQSFHDTAAALIELVLEYDKLSNVAGALDVDSRLGMSPPKFKSLEYELEGFVLGVPDCALGVGLCLSIGNDHDTHLLALVRVLRTRNSHLCGQSRVVEEMSMCYAIIRLHAVLTQGPAHPGYSRMCDIARYLSALVEHPSLSRVLSEYSRRVFALPDAFLSEAAAAYAEYYLPPAGVSAAAVIKCAVESENLLIAKASLRFVVYLIHQPNADAYLHHFDEIVSIDRLAVLPQLYKDYCSLLNAVAAEMVSKGLECSGKEQEVQSNQFIAASWAPASSPLKGKALVRSHGRSTRQRDVGTIRMRMKAVVGVNEEVSGISWKSTQQYLEGNTLGLTHSQGAADDMDDSLCDSSSCHSPSDARTGGLTVPVTPLSWKKSRNVQGETRASHESEVFDRSPSPLRRRELLVQSERPDSSLSGILVGSNTPPREDSTGSVAPSSCKGSPVGAPLNEAGNARSSSDDERTIVKVPVMSLERMAQNDHALEGMETFATRRKLNPLSVSFMRAVLDYGQETNLTKSVVKSRVIIGKYLKNSSTEMPISPDTVAKVLDTHSRSPSAPPITIFDEAMEQVKKYVRGSLYRQYVEYLRL